MLKKGPFIGMSQIVRVIADDNQVLLYLEAIPCHTESHTSSALLLKQISVFLPYILKDKQRL